MGSLKNNFPYTCYLLICVLRCTYILSREQDNVNTPSSARGRGGDGVCKNWVTTRICRFYLVNFFIQR